VPAHHHPRETAELALTVACRYCGAAAGVKCVTAIGRVSRDPHIERVISAEARLRRRTTGEW